MQRRGGQGGQPVKGQRAVRPKPRKAPIPQICPDPQEQVSALIRELKEAREQQAATADVLKVISSSPGELDRVFKEMLEKATQICGASFGTLLLFDGNAFRRVAAHNAPREYVQFADREPFIRLGTARSLDRLTKTKEPVQIADMAEAEPNSPLTKLGGARTYFAVPMLKENELIGAIGIYRQEVRPFTEKQIELVENFAAQAVIAIENTRMLTELRESLQQQTATSEVLSVISSSPGELEPVFNAMLANATRICEATFGHLWLFEGSVFRAVAVHGTQGFVDHMRHHPMVDLQKSPGIPLDRLARTRELVHITDLRTDDSYIRKVTPQIVALVETSGARTFVSVPMLKDGELVGAINLYRQEVRPFTDKQIELLTNFAAQAVIAIENTRLLNELRQRTDDLTESLEQQTATSEILEVISNSPTDTQPAFDAIVHSALNLFPDAVVTISLPDRDLVKLGAIGGADEAGVEALRGRFPMPLSHEFITGTAILDRREIDLADAREPPKELTAGAQNLLAAGYRAMTVVPMVRGDETIGTLNVVRRNPGPLSEKQRQLLRTFANQAVIAIENTRLFNELRQRTDDLTEALEQQTATSEVLRVISSSPTNVQPVFDAIAESAVRLCDGQFSFVVRFDGKVMDFASYCGLSAEGLDAFHSILPMPASEETAAGRAVVRRAVVEIPDVETDPSYGAQGQGLAKAVNYRSIAAVPLLNEGNPIGAIAVARANAGSFPNRQIGLLQAFADQAVIAIANVRLFDEVQARTRELAKSLDDLRTTQDRLVQTQKLASLGQLTAGIAHEIKNPLNFVNNFSGLSSELIDELQEALGDVSLIEKRHGEITELMDTLRGNLDKVIQHGKRADAIVKNMLQHSREGSGEHGPVDINALVEECLSLAWHGARAEKKGFAITRKQSFDPSAGEVDIFPQDITRALLNLISNGFYAATKRNTETNGGDYEPTLTASTRNLGDRVEIRIRDNGTGVPPDVKEKMFNPFFTTKPTGEGTGLGLSISHDIIVKQHAGSIDVDTQPGEFTEIIVTLPRAAVFV